MATTEGHPILGTQGRGQLAGAYEDWSSSEAARQNVGTYVSWLQLMAEQTRKLGILVPDLINRFHGRGPSGHLGVPQEQISKFVTAYTDAVHAIELAYRQWADTYGSYARDAEERLTQQYGHEVLQAATQAHTGGTGR